MCVTNEIQYIDQSFLIVSLIKLKLIKPSNTTLDESQVTRYSVKLPGRHVSVCRDHHQVLRAKD